MARIHYYGDARNRVSTLKVCIATPCFSDVSSSYASCLMAAAIRLEREKIDFCSFILGGNCHVDDGRNRLVRDFLETDCTDLLFIDADLWFNPADVIKILSYDKDVVAGVYPYKQDNEDYPVDFLPDVSTLGTDGLLEVNAVPTGFLRIKRHVLESLAATSQSFPAKNDFQGRMQQPIIFERIHHNGTRLGGDYAFCAKWRRLGGQIFVDPRMTFEHCGEKSWRGNLLSFLKKRDGKAMTMEVEDIRAGKEDPETMISMVEQYGNSMFTVMPELLQASVLVAREASCILECGSGLTTLAMAAANPNAEIISLESDKDWAEKTRVMLDGHGVKNVQVIHAPLKDYGNFLWYDWQPNGHKFDMVLCDGPTRQTKGGRRGMASVANNAIKDGAVMLFDDYDSYNHNEVASWGGDVNSMGVGRLFAVTRKNSKNQKEIAV